MHLVCAVITPAEWSEESHHELLARVAAPLRLQRQRQKIADAEGGASTDDDGTTSGSSGGSPSGSIAHDASAAMARTTPRMGP